MLMLKRNAKEDDAERIERKGIPLSLYRFILVLLVILLKSSTQVSHPTPSHLPALDPQSYEDMLQGTSETKTIIGC